ncbi:MAG: alpha/beta hydrolase [Bacteroidetes bacterium]|nr:alpha/beta hydrolase [Bacteroidota bacterium]MCH8524620.1 alpha/beta hydrolase [Balneolales bacterium]
MEINESTFDFNGLSVKSCSFGKGKPLIVLHGWGANSDVMKPITTSLKLKRTFHLLDFPGFGQSPPPPKAWAIDDYADMVQTYIQQLERPVDILAHSFGGRVTLKLCAREGSTSLIDKVLITGGAGMKPNRPVMYYIRKYTAKSLKFPFTLLPQPLSERGLSWLRSTKLWKLLGSSDYKTLNGVMREVFVKTVSEYLESTLPKIDQEVLLLWGKDDDATPLYQARRMEKGIKNAGLAVIDGAGHYAFLDRSHQFKIITETFFK